MAITYRSALSRPLTKDEVDANFLALTQDIATENARTDLGAMAPAVQVLVDSVRDRSIHTGYDVPNLNERLENYTLTLTDSAPATIVRMNVATDNAVTVPAHATTSISIGTRIPIDQWGVGQTTIVAATGVTIRTPASLQVKSRYSRVWLEKQGTDEWLLTGDLALGGSIGAPPVCTVPPSISGTAVSGSTLTRVAGTWTGTPTPTVTGQWYANAVAISGQTAATYVTANPGDDGKAITYRESAVNTAGGPTQATSNSITMTPVAATKPVSNGTLPVITGNGTGGSVLTATTGGWTNSPTTHKWQWYHDGTTLLEDTGQIGGTTDTYTVLSGSTAKTITVKVTASNASGDTDVPVTSAGFPISAGPTFQSASIPTAGTTLSVVWSSAVSLGADGGTTGISVTATPGGLVTATYSSGAASATLVYTLSRTINSGEAVTIAYAQPGDGIKSTANGSLATSFVGGNVTNSSTAGTAITWEAPITISTGGTHTYTNRNFRSQSDSTPCVTLSVSATVSFTNCRFDTTYRCFQAIVGGASVTFTNCSFRNRLPSVLNQAIERCMGLGGITTFIVENCSFYGGGIYFAEATPTTFRVKYNKFRNLDGRKSDGAGGYVFEPINSFTYFSANPAVQFNEVTAGGPCEIGWNEVINTAGQSRPEDGMNFFQSSGTSTNRVNIHDNFIYGGWNSRPYDIDFSGGGLIFEPIAGTNNYFDVDDNIVVAYNNVGFGVNDNASNFRVRRNRFINSGKLSGLDLHSPNVAAYVYAAASTSMVFEDNISSWMLNRTTGLYIGSGSVTNTNWTVLAQKTEADEATEVTNWNTKVTNAAVTLGSTIPDWW